MNSKKSYSTLFLHGLGSRKLEVLKFKNNFDHFDSPCFIPELTGHRFTIPRSNEVRLCNWDLEIHTYLRYLTQNFTQQIIVSGQSFGTLLAIKIAATYPELIKGLMLFSPSLKLRNPTQDKLITLLSLMPSFITKRFGSIKKSKVSKHHIESKAEYSINMVKYLGHYRRFAFDNLKKIKLPIVVIQSINDYHLCPTSSLIVKEKALNSNVQIVLKDFGEVHNLNEISQLNGLIKNGLEFICLEK